MTKMKAFYTLSVGIVAILRMASSLGDPTLDHRVAHFARAFF
jgi:hypothetical protein